MLALPTVDLLDLFPDFQVTVKPFSFLAHGSPPMDIALLVALAKQYDDLHYLEIGTWRGESVANVAPHAVKCVTIDLPESDMLLYDYNGFDKVSGIMSKGISNVTHLRTNSTTFDFSMLQDKFDMIFVDGCHHPYVVEKDTVHAFKLLRNEKSIIVWHDYGLNNEAVNKDVLNGILAGCPEECKQYLFHVSNTMCAVYIKQDLPTRSTQFPAIPDKVFTLTIAAKRITKEQ